MKWLVPFLLAAAAFGQQTNSNIVPATTGLYLGAQNQRWNAYLNNINVTGTCIVNGQACALGVAFNPASPGNIGTTTPGSGSFTALNASSLGTTSLTSTTGTIATFNSTTSTIATLNNTTLNGVTGNLTTMNLSQLAITGDVTGEGLCSGSTYSLSCNDAIRVSALCNTGVAGTLSYLTCLNYSDVSVAIQAAVTAVGAKGTMHIIYDMCGIQTWSVQPFQGAGNNIMVGLFEFRSNCPASNPSIISLDGVSTILVPGGLWVVGQGTAIGALTPQYGSAGNSAQGTYIRACNPAIYPCLNGGFQIQSGTIASTTSTASNLSLITMTGKPFTFSSTAINNLQQYRMIHIVGATSGGTTNNAAWVVSDCNTTGCNSNPQTFHIAVPTGFVACPATCGATAYLDTPLMAIGGAGGNGAFGTQVINLTLDGSWMSGTIGIVNGIGQELTGWHHVNAYNMTIAGFRIDQSAAYNGASFASSNSGDYGPDSSNPQAVTCGNTTCQCFGSSGTGANACSSLVAGTPGTVPTGAIMSVGAGVTFATIYPDPAVNSNFHNYLFTGAAGQQGFGLTNHLTATIADKTNNGNPVPQFATATTGTTNNYGAGGIVGTTFACGMGFYGIHGTVVDYHHEYALGGICIGGDANRTGTFYYAYTNPTAPANPIITSAVHIINGFAGASNFNSATSIEIDIGTQASDAPFIGEVYIDGLNVQNGGSAITVQNNVNGEVCKSFGTAPGSDYVLSYFYGHSTTASSANLGLTGLAMPMRTTSCASLPHFVGNAFGFPMISTNTLAAYGVAVKADTTNPGQFIALLHTDGAGIPIGVSYSPVTAGQIGAVVTTGVVPMRFDTAGTGNCSTLGMFVIAGTTNDGRVQCTASYSAGTVIGKNSSLQSTSNGVVNVIVGLR